MCLVDQLIGATARGFSWQVIWLFLAQQEFWGLTLSMLSTPSSSSPELLTRLEWVEFSDIDRKEPEKEGLCQVEGWLVTINLAQLCLHAGHPLDRVEEHVGVELQAEGKLVVAVHVHDARRVPRTAEAHLRDL